MNVDDVMDSTYTPPPDNVEKYVKEFIVALAIPYSIRAKGVIDITVTTENHEQAWKI